MLPILSREPLPKFDARKQRTRRPKEYVPGDLRPCERLAYSAALEESASLDAQGIDHSVVTYRSQGQCLLLVGERVVAWTFAVTDEPITTEALVSDFRDRLRQVSAELEAGE